MNFKAITKLNTIFQKHSKGKRTGFIPGVNLSDPGDKKKGVMKLKSIIDAKADILMNMREKDIALRSQKVDAQNTIHTAHDDDDVLQQNNDKLIPLHAKCKSPDVADIIKQKTLQERRAAPKINFIDLVGLVVNDESKRIQQKEKFK